MEVVQADTLFLITGLLRNVLAILGVTYNCNISYYANNMQHNMAAFNPPSNKAVSMKLGQVDIIAGLVSNVQARLGVIYNGKMPAANGCL